jgi:serine/threonine-protein kinase
VETHSPNVDDIFLAALERENAEQRSAFLEEACAGNADLRRRVERLLDAQAKDCSFLESPAPELRLTVDQSSTAIPGTVVGAYKLIALIGEGGMGTVWMAQQTEPVKRLVAVKLIKAGMDSKQVVARFEVERQALALMDHPHIARVLDGGTTATGRPYFVMDLVKGVPITKYCDEHRLTTRQRLELYLPVCQAVQHAHQKGIIHRDLKPSNVLVALYDGNPVPKVIDFGVAKATGQSLTDKTPVTGFGNLVGTLEYMSPEQAEINQLDIDTRSDIYSLGVLLYELLTGSPPFTRKELEKAGMLEMLRVIREQEPSKPSMKLSTSQGLPTLAANRGTEPARLTKLVRGELDWIVMKALEKDRNRRYETANGFAMDVQRYLADEAVQACPPSVGYRFRKFARRNKSRLAVTAVFAVVLLTGAGISAWQAIRATAAEQQAKAETVRAEGEAKSARTEAAISNAINDFINRDLLAQADPNIPYSGDTETSSELRLRTVLDRAARRIEGRFKDQPLVEAALRQTIGWTYLRLNQDRQAEPHLRRAVELRRAHLGAEDRATLQSVQRLAETHRDAGEMRQVLEAQRRVLGPEHPDTYLSMFFLAQILRDKRDYVQAVALLRETLAGYRRVLGEDSPQTVYTGHVLAHSLVLLGDAGGPADDSEIERLYRVALGFWRKRQEFGWHAWDITARTGQFFESRRRFEEAEAVLREGYERLQHLPGAPPDWSAELANELVSTYRAWGKPALAAEWERKQKGAQVAALVRKTGLLLERPDDIDPLVSEAALLAEFGRLDEAASVCRKVIQIKADSFEAHHELAKALSKQEKWVEAAAACRAGLQIRPDVRVQHVLGYVLGRLGKFAEAEAAYREAIRLAPKEPALHHGFADIRRQQGKFAEAEAEYREAGRLDATFAALPHLGDMLCHQMGDFDRGVPVLREAARCGPKNPATQAALGNACARTGRWDEATAAYRRATELAPDDHWIWFLTATLDLSAGNTDNYRRICGQMLERFGNTADPLVADRTAMVCLLTPNAVADSASVQKLAERSVTGTEEHQFHRRFMLVKALSEYRAERHEEATRWIQKFAPNPTSGGSDVTAALAILAMARHQLGEAEEARMALVAAQRIMAMTLRKTEKGERLGDDWFYWVQAQLLCREAEKLLEE